MKEMASKTITLMNLHQHSKKEGQKARDRRVNKRKEESPVKWLGKEWMTLFKKKYPEIESEWTGKDASIVKMLVKERGFDKTLDLIKYFLKTWTRRKASRTGIPNVGFMWAIRNQLDAEMSGKAKLPILREQKVVSGEWQKGAEKHAPTEGWGDIGKEDLSIYEKYMK